MRRTRMTLGRIWLAFSTLVVLVSLATGYRASRAAGAPVYLLTKTSVVVERPAVAADAQEAEILRRMAEAGEDSRVSELQPMFVLGLLDAALPLVLFSGLLVWGAGFVRRRRARRRFANAGADSL